MDSDIQYLYSRLHCKYSLELKSSLKMGFKTGINFPVLCGYSTLGRFELFYGDLDYEFYAAQDNGDFLVHFHVPSVAEAEKLVVNFMNGIITIVGQ